MGKTRNNYRTDSANKKGPAIAGPLNKSIPNDYFKVAGQGLPALDLTFTIMKSP